jgi:hypothetical protein
VALGTKAKALRMAAEMLGGPSKLSRFVQASSRDMAQWLSGMQQPPPHVFEAALKLILDDLDTGGQRLRRVRRSPGKTATVLKARRKTTPK